MTTRVQPAIVGLPIQASERSVLSRLRHLFAANPSVVMLGERGYSCYPNLYIYWTQEVRLFLFPVDPLSGSVSDFANAALGGRFGSNRFFDDLGAQNTCLLEMDEVVGVCRSAGGVHTVTFYEPGVGEGVLEPDNEERQPVVRPLISPPGEMALLRHVTAELFRNEELARLKFERVRREYRPTTGENAEEGG